MYALVETELLSVCCVFDYRDRLAHDMVIVCAWRPFDRNIATDEEIAILKSTANSGMSKSGLAFQNVRGVNQSRV